MYHIVTNLPVWLSTVWLSVWLSITSIGLIINEILINQDLPFKNLLEDQYLIILMKNGDTF